MLDSDHHCVNVNVTPNLNLTDMRYTPSALNDRSQMIYSADGSQLCDFSGYKIFHQGVCSVCPPLFWLLLRADGVTGSLISDTEPQMCVSRISSDGIINRPILQIWASTCQLTPSTFRAQGVDMGSYGSFNHRLAGDIIATYRTVVGIGGCVFA